jgi:hypothetical protein
VTLAKVFDSSERARASTIDDKKRHMLLATLGYGQCRRWRAGSTGPRLMAETPTNVEDTRMTQDKVIRSLVIVALVLGAAILGLLLLGWLGMAGMMAGGGCCGAMTGDGMGMASVGVGVLAVLLIAGVVAALIWALRTPVHRAE